MRTLLIVIDPPRFDDGLRVGEGCELMDVQAFVPQARVKRFDMPIVGRLSQSGEVEGHAVRVGPESSACDVNSLP